MKKRRAINALAALIVLGGAVGSVVACGEVEYGDENEGEVVPVTSYYLELSSSKDVSIGETITVVPMVTPSDATGEFSYQSSDPNVAYVNDNGKVTGIATGTATITVTAGNYEGDESARTQTIGVTVGGTASNAVGVYNYAGLDYEDSLEILGKLEEYAIENNITGMTLFESGGYVMYADRVSKATENYISGYGFGILSEGSLTSANTNYSSEGTDWYYHSYAGTTNAQNFNYLDDTGSVSSDLYGYVSGSYYSTRMNDTKDGYEWYASLANEFPSTDPNVSASSLTETQLNRPVALNKNETTGLATQYRIYLKTGYDYVNGQETLSGGTVAGDGLTYSASENSIYHDEYDGRPVSIEDYVTPYLLLLNGSYGLARSTDMISDSSDGTLKGARAWYNATSNNYDITEDSNARSQFWNLVGIDIGLDEDPSSPDAPCITFTLNKPLSEFDAMYALSSTLVSPIPLDFIMDLGATELGYTSQDQIDNDEGNCIYQGIKNAYGITGKANNSNVVNNLLSVGPYVLDYSSSTEIQYSRNDDYVDNFEVGRYNIEGINLHYLAGMSSDTNLAFEEFLNGNLDAASIPQDYLDEYRDNPNTTTTQGDSTFKLNINSCTQDEWEAIFGDNGTNPNGGTSYSVNPLMSNDKFVQALSYAINRETFAGNRGSLPSQDYFADAYMWEPEQGYSYNDTAQHIGNLSDRSPETYGYNFDVAVALMDEAIEEEINKGNYDSISEDYTTSEYGGTNRTNNNLGVIQISWMNTTDADEYGDEIISYWEAVFQATDAYRQGFRIAFTQDNGNTDYQVVYTTMREGTFDLGFGAISGMTLDPLGFMEVLKSDNGAGFTLNYSGDTDSIDEEDGKVIYYDNKKWSYDGLWEAANNGAIIGDDYHLVDDPLTITNTNTQDVPETWKNMEVYQLAFDYRKATEAAAATMKIAADEDEEFTVTGSYAHGDETETITFNLELAEYGDVDDTGSVTTELTSAAEGGYIDLYIPRTLSTDLTYLESEISFLDLSDVYIYFTVYTTYYEDASDTVGLTISSTYTVQCYF